jgi:iron complex transport system substrate-binding protein
MKSSLTAFALLILTTPLATAAPWTYTDGAGHTVTLPEPPQRIIAHSTVTAALLPYGIEPVGILVDGAPALDRTLESSDVTGIPLVSSGWFEIDAEAILALDPDIIITEYSLAENIYQGGTHEGAIRERLESIAPIIGIARTSSVLDMLEDYESFAQSLGGSSSPANEQAKVEFAAAREDFTTTVAAKPGLTVMAASPSSSGFYVAAYDRFGELNDMVSWALDIPHADAPVGQSYLAVPWENLLGDEADILLLDDRWETSGRDALLANPISQRLEAVKAGQIGDWPAEWIRTYADYARELGEITALIERSDPDLVD